MKKIAVMGYGVVGSGVVEVIYKNKKQIEKKLNDEITVKYILDLRDFPDSPYKDKFIKDFDIIKNDDEISVVAEVMGGVNPAFGFVKACLESGKSVVTSNKELVAKKGAELLKIAKKNNVNFFFEASVGGGIPILRPLHSCLAANRIEEVAGILNGTTNFILTEMIKNNMAFDNALKLAQRLGYAEKDPTADIDGHDACRKICILASIAFGKHIYPDNVETEGIRNITLTDVEYINDVDGVIKLIGRAKITDDDKIIITVSPAVISRTSGLSSVDDVFNAILVRGNAVGELMFYGRGAGKLPTASAVVADIIDAANRDETIKTLSWEDSDGSSVIDYRQNVCAFYIRTKCSDALSASKKAKEIFSEIREIPEARKNGEFTFITKEYKEEQIEKMVDDFCSDGIELVTRIRVLDY